MDLSTGNGAPQNAPVDFGVDPRGGWDNASPANAAQQGIEPDWGVKPGNDPAHEWDDGSPASTPSSGMGAGPDEPSLAAPPPAPLTSLEIGHAALICGYSTQKSANPISDAELAQYFGTSPNVIAARREDFLRRYVIVTARDALSTSPVLCRAIRNNPSIGSQVQPDVPLLARLENALDGGWKYFRNVVARNIPKDMSVAGAMQAFGGTTLDLLKDAHDAVTSTAGNELTGIARGAMHVGTALGDAPMMAFNRIAGGNNAEKQWIGSALQAEKWMFGNTDDSTSAVSNLAYAATQGLGGGTSDLMRAASILSAVPAVMMDKTAGLFTGCDYDEAEKWWYSNTADKLEAYRPSYELAADSGLAEKAAHGLGSLAALLPYMYLTGGAGGTAEAATGIFARLASGASQGAKAMPIPAIAAYVNTGNDVFEKTGDPAAAQKAAAMSGFTTLLNGMVPLAIPGKMAMRVISGMPAGMGAGEASRLLNNLALPETMQHEFDRDNLLVNGILGSAMAGLGPHGPDPAPEPQLHADIAKAIEAFEAAQYYKYLASISETGKGVSLGKSNPGLLQDILLEMGDKTGNRALTVRAGDFIKAVEEGGITPQRLQADLPEVYAQLLSLPPDGSLQIPHATLAQHPELLEPVLPHARIASGAPSGAEALAQANEHFDNLARKIQAAAERQAEGEAGQPGANEAVPQGEGKNKPASTDLVLEENARTAKRLYNKLLKLNELEKKSPLRQSDPTRFAQEVQKIMGLSPGKGFHVNGRVLLGMLRADCKDRKDFSLLADVPSIAPDLARQLPKAIEGNGDVLVPFDVFTVHFAGRMDGLIPYAKPALGMPSHAEAQALLKGKPNPAENHGNTGAQSWGKTHPPLPPAQVKVPGGGLRAHEAIGGHVLERHVGKTEKELADRYIKEPKIPASSSFHSEAVAEEAVAATIKANQADIDAWLASSNSYLPPITATMHAPVGITIPKGSTVAHSAYGVKLVLIRDRMTPLGFYILTGFPE